ncbi:30S ribosome-binding factor RbfA [Opitutaceae bacterium EW11]|nr:30S ribosome-binding factor RbfA [Opitutaceae bacterium EW11]
MSNRTLRVNELIQRELSDILRKKYQSEALALTITAVDVAPDLRDGRVYVSVMGDATVAAQKLKWLRANSQDIRFELGRRIVLKYMPQFVYKLDESTVKGNRVLQLLDELGPSETKPAPEEEKS